MTDELDGRRAVAASASVGADADIHPTAAVHAGARVDHAALAEGAVVSPNAVVLGSDDARIRLGAGVVVGANATVCPGVAVGRGAVIRPGAVVESDVPAMAIVAGNPGRIIGYVDSGQPLGGPRDPPRTIPGPTGVGQAALIELGSGTDLRGELVVAEFDRLPFVPRRLFFVYGVPNESVRGSHAHRDCDQLLIPAAGSLRCVVDDGRHRSEVILDRPDVGLHVPAGVWATQYRYSPGSVLLVLASHPYDPADYIRDYDEFLDFVGVAR